MCERFLDVCVCFSRRAGLGVLLQIVDLSLNMLSQKRKSSCPLANSKTAPERKSLGKRFENHQRRVRDTSDHIAARARYDHLGPDE